MDHNQRGKRKLEANIQLKLFIWIRKFQVHACSTTKSHYFCLALAFFFFLNQISEPRKQIDTWTVWETPQISIFCQIVKYHLHLFPLRLLINKPLSTLTLTILFYFVIDWKPEIHNRPLMLFWNVFIRRVNGFIITR